MTIIDLFVDMLNEKEVNEILQRFHESSKNGGFDFKKIKLRKIFKRQSAKTANRGIASISDKTHVKGIIGNEMAILPPLRYNKKFPRNF